MSELSKHVINAALDEKGDGIGSQLHLDFKKKPIEIDRKDREERLRKDTETAARFYRKIEDDKAAKSREIAMNKEAREAKKLEDRRTFLEKKAAEEAARKEAIIAKQGGNGLVGYAKENYERSRQIEAILSREELLDIIFKNVLTVLEAKVGKTLSEDVTLRNTIAEIVENICEGRENRNGTLSEEEQTRAFSVVNKLARSYAGANVPVGSTVDALRLLESTARECLGKDPLSNHSVFRKEA